MIYRVVKTSDDQTRKELVRYLTEGWEILSAIGVMVSKGDLSVTHGEYVLRRK